MEIEVYIPETQTSLDNLEKCLPSMKRLKKLAKEPPLGVNVTRRVINVIIDKGRLTGYIIHDWKEDTYWGFRKYSD